MTALCVVVMFDAIILCKARRFWILGCESRLSNDSFFLSSYYYSAIFVLFVFWLLRYLCEGLIVSHCLRLYILDFGNCSWTGRPRIC